MVYGKCIVLGPLCVVCKISYMASKLQFLFNFLALGWGTQNLFWEISAVGFCTLKCLSTATAKTTAAKHR